MHCNTFESKLFDADFEIFHFVEIRARYYVYYVYRGKHNILYIQGVVGEINFW